LYFNMHHNRGAPSSGEQYGATWARAVHGEMITTKLGIAEINATWRTATTTQTNRDAYAKGLGGVSTDASSEQLTVARLR
jgi:hypothetical protein